MFKFFTFFFLLVLLGVAFSPSAHAQTELRRMEITQTSAPAQGVAVFRDYPDKAAIVIESPITTLRFSSNVEGIVREMHEPDRGRYVLIIEPYTQILVIDAPGFIQQRQRIGNPQAREVRYFEIKPEETTSNLISVIFNVTPPDAKLFVDGQETAINQTVQIAPGSAEVRLEREGYRAITDVIEVNERNIQFNYRLQEIDLVLVQIRSANIGANVTINGMSQGEIDRSGARAIFLYPDSYTLQVSQSGFIPQTRQIEVTESGSNIFSMDLIRNIGELSLQVTPADAKVSVNRVDYSGQGLIELAPGRYRLDVEKEHHEPYSETIEIPLNQRISRVITLEAHTGTLQFMVTPNNAQVELVDASGRVANRWIGTQILRNIQAGTYTLKVSSGGHISKEQRITIQRNQMAQVTIELQESSWLQKMSTALVGNSTFERISMVGKFAQGPMQFNINVTYGFPGFLRQEVITPMGSQVISFENGEAKVSAGGQEQTLPPQFAAQFRNTLNRHYLNLAKNAGSLEVVYLGSEEINDHTAVKLFIAEYELHVYLDSETSLPIMMKYSEFNPQAGAEVNYEAHFSDWTEADGVKAAWKEVQKANGEVQATITVTSHTLE